MKITEKIFSSFFRAIYGDTHTHTGRAYEKEGSAKKRELIEIKRKSPNKRLKLRFGS